jgi:FMN phosphatase YigB (HAD superfamily)
MKQKISVVITDLDNTLYDWLGIWHSSFKAMLDRLVSDSGISEEILIHEFKHVHEKYGTAEYSFSIEELPSLQRKYPGEDLAKRFEAPIRAYREARNQTLALYPTVLETLETLKDKGCLLVGYTESAEFYTARRVKKLGLDRILDFIWSSPDSELPPGFSKDQVRSFPDEYYRLRRTVHRTLKKGELKPNPQVLSDIIRDIGANSEEVIYVGDNLMKDVSMAQMAGIIDVWAEYGAAQNRPEYELLRKVTHWTASDVEREKKTSARQQAPSHTLGKDLGELLTQFDFVPFLQKTDEHFKLIVDLWKKTVDVQQHFNDLELRVRNYALTVLAALFALAGYALKEGLTANILGHTTSVSSLILLITTLPWAAFYLMDRWWYHRLLHGAVEHGSYIEKRWQSVIPEIGLSQTISRRSPFKFLKRFPLHTDRKIDIWYGLVLALILFFAFAADHVAVSKSDASTKDSGPTLRLLQ